MRRHGALIIEALILCSFIPLLLANVERTEKHQSAEIGKDGSISYAVTEKRQTDRDSRCNLEGYNCTTPQGLCSDNHDKYQLALVDGSDYFDGSSYTWLCNITIKQVTLDDVGVYTICKLPHINADTYADCNRYYDGLDVNFSAWKRDEHGRICQTSYDEISTDLVNNCSALTTQLATTEKEETPSPTPKVQSTKSSKVTVKVGASNDQLNADEEPDDTSKCYNIRDITLTAVGVLIAVFVVIAVIWTIRRVRKRRRRKFGNDFEGYTPGLPMGAPTPVSNGHTVHDDIDHAEAERPA